MIWSCGSSKGSWKAWLIFKTSNSRCTSLPRAGRQCSLSSSLSQEADYARVLSLKSLKCNSWPCLFRVHNPAAFERNIPEVLAVPTLYCTRWARQQYHVSTEQGLERAHEAPCLLLVRNRSAVTKVSCTIWIDPLVTCINSKSPEDLDLSLRYQFGLQQKPHFRWTQLVSKGTTVHSPQISGQLAIWEEAGMIQLCFLGGFHAIFTGCGHQRRKRGNYLLTLLHKHYLND